MQDVKSADPATVVFFDGSCPLCRAEIDFYKGRDGAGALCLVDVAAPESVLPGGLARDHAMARFHVLSRDGRLLSGAAAFAELWRQLPGWRWAGRLATLPGVTGVLEIGYRLFIRLRPAFVWLFVGVQRARAGSGRWPRRSGS